MESNNQHEKADLLWKAIIEDFIVKVIEYFYPTLATQRDKRKKIEFLDKFLQTLHPEAAEGNRRADLLIKVPLKNGRENGYCCILKSKGYAKKIIQIIGNFIRDLIGFKNKKYNRIFVEEVNNIEQNNPTMGIIETVIKYNRSRRNRKAY